VSWVLEARGLGKRYGLVGRSQLHVAGPGARDVLGRAAGRARARERDPPPRVDADRHASSLAVGQVALIGVAALAIAGLASWLVSWWFAPLDAVNRNRFDPSVFAERGFVAIGYAGFAFALGVAAGRCSCLCWLPARPLTCSDQGRNSFCGGIEVCAGQCRHCAVGLSMHLIAKNVRATLSSQ